MTRYLIIGSGVAAVSAAEAIRERDAENPIILYTEESILPYRRPALPKLLAAPLSDTQLYQKPEAFYREKSIHVRTDFRAIRIDRPGRRVIFENGDEDHYDKLLLATGGDAFMPPLPGMNFPNVGVLRKIADVERIQRQIQEGVRHWTIIGGGILALDIAENLIAAGCHVVMIEGEPRLLPRQMTPEQSVMLEERLAEITQIDVYLNSYPTMLLGGKKAEKIRLMNDAEIAVEGVLVATGMTPATMVAETCGLDVARGIRTDRRMRTGDPAIYAAGDCAETANCPSMGLYLPAREMGRVAGNAMTGGEMVYEPKCPPFNIKQVPFMRG